MNNNFIANFMTDFLGSLVTRLIKFMTYHHLTMAWMSTKNSLKVKETTLSL